MKVSSIAGVLATLPEGGFHLVASQMSRVKRGMGQLPRCRHMDRDELQIRASVSSACGRWRWRIQEGPGPRSAAAAEMASLD